MKVLLHICCAPCAIYPLDRLCAGGADVTGFFFNHNIHPYQEYRRRLATVQEFARMANLSVEYREEYLLDEFLASVASAPAERCGYCYASRLRETARTAAIGGYDAFTSSLLYSRYQQHEVIRSLGEELGKEFGIDFLYEDFRIGWQEGIKKSKELNLYRQQYCGCIYSERDRYRPR